MRPAAGTECAQCRREKGHRCQAQMFDADNVPLCLPCANGEPCVIDRVGAPTVAEPELFEVEIPPAPVIHRTPEELGLPAVLPADPDAPERKSEIERRRDRAQAVSLHAAVENRAKKVMRRLQVKVVGGGEKLRISPHSVMGADMIAPEREKTMPIQIPEEVKSAAVADAKNMTLKEAAAKHGVALSTLSRWSRGNSKPAKSKALMKRGQQPVAINGRGKGSVDALIDDGAVRVRLEFELTPAQARERFEKLTPAQMAIALTAVLQASLGEG